MLEIGLISEASVTDTVVRTPPNDAFEQNRYIGWISIIAVGSKQDYIDFITNGRNIHFGLLIYYYVGYAFI